MDSSKVDESRLIGVALAGLAGLALAIGIGRFSYTAMLPMMQVDQGLSLSAGSWLALANLLGYLIGGLTATYLRHRAVECLRLSMVLIVTTMVLMALGTNVWWWSIWRLIAGVASAWTMVMVSILCLPRLSSKPSLAGWVYSGVGTGIFLGGLACLILVVLNFNASSAWLVLALVCATLGVFVWHQLTPVAITNKTMSAQTSPSDRAAEIDQRRLCKLVICYGLYGFGYILPATYLPAQARLLLENHWAYGVAWPIFGLAAMCSTLVAGFVAHRLGRLPTWVIAHVVMALGLVVPVMLPQLTGVVLAAIAVGGTFVVITLLAMQEAQRLAGREAPIWLARLTTAFAAGQMAGPIFVMWVGERLVLCLLVAAGVLLVSAGILFQQWRHDEKTLLKHQRERLSP